MTLPFALLFIASGALHLASAFAIAWLLLRLRAALRDLHDSDTALRAAVHRELRAQQAVRPVSRWTSTVGVT